MIVRDYIMFKGSKLSAMDLMAKNLMIMIKSMQNKMKEIFKHNFYNYKSILKYGFYIF